MGASGIYRVPGKLKKYQRFMVRNSASARDASSLNSPSSEPWVEVGGRESLGFHMSSAQNLCYYRAMLPNIRWGYWGLSQSIRKIHNWPTSIIFFWNDRGCCTPFTWSKHWFTLPYKIRGLVMTPSISGFIYCIILYPLSSLGISSDAGMTIPHIPSYTMFLTMVHVI